MLWQILKVKSDAVLNVHDYLSENDIEVYTPFETKYLRTSKQQRKKRVRISYVEPLFKGYLIIKVEGNTNRLAELIAKNANIYGFIMHNDAPYCLSLNAIDDLKEIYPTGYKTSKHSKKNRQKKYKPDVFKQYSPGELVQFKTGSMAGLQLSVQSQVDNNLILMLNILGTPRKVETAIENIKPVT